MRISRTWMIFTRIFFFAIIVSGVVGAMTLQAEASRNDATCSTKYYVNKNHVLYRLDESTGRIREKIDTGVKQVCGASTEYAYVLKTNHRLYYYWYNQPFFTGRPRVLNKTLIMSDVKEIDANLVRFGSGEGFCVLKTNGVAYHVTPLTPYMNDNKKFAKKKVAPNVKDFDCEVRHQTTNIYYIDSNDALRGKYVDKLSSSSKKLLSGVKSINAHNNMCRLADGRIYWATMNEGNFYNRVAKKTRMS